MLDRDWRRALLEFARRVHDHGGLYAAWNHTHAEDAITGNHMGVGTATTGALLGGTTQTVTVTIAPAMPSTTYNISAVITGGLSVLGSLEIQSMAAVSKTSCTVTVKNQGLVSLTGNVLVITNA